MIGFTTPLLAFYIGRLNNISGCPWGFWFMILPREPETRQRFMELECWCGYAVQMRSPIGITQNIGRSYAKTGNAHAEAG